MENQYPTVSSITTIAFNGVIKINNLPWQAPLKFFTASDDLIEYFNHVPCYVPQLSN